MPEFKISLAAARVNADMTQDKAAEEIGVSKSTIVAWESGKRSPNMHMLARLCEVYKTPVSVIFLPDSTT